MSSFDVGARDLNSGSYPSTRALLIELSLHAEILLLISTNKFVCIL